MGRVWGVGGLWNETARRRPPEIEKLDLCLWDQNEKMWLYRVEDAVLMLEVMPVVTPSENTPGSRIGQVVLTRLISAEQVIERLSKSKSVCQPYPPS